jgi:hypothetical protein
VGSQLDTFRETRRDIEASVLPLATSVDGRRFSFQASLHGLELQAGGYAVLDDGGTRRLGQVLSVELHQQLAGELTLPSAAGGPETRTELQIRAARGEGIIVDGSSAPFHDALIRPAAGSEVLEWQRRETGPHAQLILGELALAPGVPCVADAAGFNRHTFLCGQSGSGKTYSLGVILERLLVLMRLNSLADAAFAQAVFSFVPPSLIERSATFRQGEALIAGKISPRQPALLRFGARISQEGGADVPVTWAAPR